MSQYFIDTSEDMGRGLYAAFDLAPGKILFTAELLVLSEADTFIVNKTDLKYYTFKYNDVQDCLVLGDGAIFNHADKPNIGFKLMDHGGRKVMCFYTLNEINYRDQLFIDYNSDTQVDIAAYNVNLI